MARSGRLRRARARRRRLRRRRRRAAAEAAAAEPVSGEIRIDGSSTVAPLTEAIAEEFQAENPDVKVTVGTSGTGGGFEKFCAGETDANDASEAIGEEEIAACEKGGVAYEELQVANDALTVVVNPENPVDLHDRRPAQVGLGAEVDDHELERHPGPRAPVRRDAGALRRRARTRARSATSPRRSTVRRTRSATTTTTSARTTTPPSPASPVARRHGLLRLLVLRGERGQAEGARDRRRPGLRRPVARDGPGRHATRRSADRCSSTRRPTALADPAFDAFLQYYLDNVNAIAEQVGFIPLTDEQLSEQQSKLESLIGGGGRRRRRTRLIRWKLATR